LRASRIIFISSILVFSQMSALSQNLVPNPSFEIHSSCPTAGSQISLATPWQGVTTNSTDYYHSCGMSGYTVPYSGSNFQLARTGSAYAAIWTVNGFGGDYREYLQVKLDSVLETDSCYLVEFYCNLNAGSRWAIGNLGLLLSDTAVNDVGPSSWGLVLQHTPQIVSQAIASDTAGWTRVSGYYQAHGGEEYITIGSFVIDSLTDTLNIGGSYAGSYYFIEDVKVQKLSSCDTTTGMNEINEAPDMIIYPNPGRSEVFIVSKQVHLKKISVTDVFGRVIDVPGNFSKEDTYLLNTNELPAGIYFIKVYDRNTACVKKFIRN
jgi:hypothetical protein